MIARKLPKTELDGILRETMRDDLSQDLETQLAEELRRAWREARSVSSDEADAPRIERSQAGAGRWLWQGLTPARAWMAAGAVMMLLVGVTGQMTGSRTALAESLSLRQVANSVRAQLLRSEKMRCRLEATDPSGEDRRYFVEWDAAGQARVRTEGSDPEKSVNRVVRLERTEFRLIDGVSARPSGSAAEADDPSLSPVRDYLSPDALWNLLDGRWEATSSQADSENRVYRIGLARHALVGYLTTDARTWLPVSLEVFAVGSQSRAQESRLLMRARFDWKLRPLVYPGSRVLPGSSSRSLIPKEGGACPRPQA